MHINDISNSAKINISPRRYRVPVFKSNLTRSVNKVKLSSSEISKISNIFSFYKELNMIFKAAGDYFNEIFRKKIAFLAPAGKDGHVLKGVFKSKIVRDIEVEKAENDEKSLIFTFGKDKHTAKVVVSEDSAELLADDNLSDELVTAYSNEFDINLETLFDMALDREKEALRLIQKIIDKKIKYDFNLNSPDEMKDVVKRFIDEKKRIALLVDLININRFMKEFKLKKGEQRSFEEGVIEGRGISFRFSHLENECFDGMQITVTDESKGTKQGFVVMANGEVFKSEVYKKEDFVPRVVWHIRRLSPLSPSDYENPDLNYMFKYAYSHTDRIYRGMLNTFFEDNKINEILSSLSAKKQEYINNLQASRLARINKFNARIQQTAAVKTTRNENVQNAPLNEDKAKKAKVYNLQPESLAIINKMVEYSNRLSEVYASKFDYQRDELNEKSGFIRRRYQNGIVFKDILTDNEYLLGLAQYLMMPLSQELISFGIFDKNLTEIARFKVANNGEATLLVKPNATKEFADNIDRMIKNEMKQGLYEKLTSRLDNAIYYHENQSAVDDYMEKSSYPLTLEQAIKEMSAPRESYRFDTNKINSLKNDLDNIWEIHHKHQTPADKWQQIYFPEIEQSAQKYMHGRIDELNINYEFIFVDNKRFSGLRILTRDKDGNFKNGYIIDFQGNAYKFITRPTDSEFSSLYNRAKLSLLDSKDVKDGNLDVIFEKICKDTNAYNNFCCQCCDKINRKVRLPREAVLMLAAEHKPNAYGFILEHNPLAHNNCETNGTAIAKDKAKTPKKSGNKDDTPKPIKPKKHKKVSVRAVKGSPQHISLPIDKTESPYSDTNVTYNVPSSMLKPNGEFKDFLDISLEDVAKQLAEIFKKSCDKRSPHLIHEVTDKGKIFKGRFYVVAPDQAIISVTTMGTSNYKEKQKIYYLIRIEKDSEVVFINIDSKDGHIINGRKQISQQDFMEDNPLCKNMSDYFAEIFAYKPDAVRKTIEHQLIITPRMLIEAQAMKDFRKAMSSSKAFEG